MQIGIFAKTFPYTDQTELFRAIRDSGFTATQYNMACLGLPSMPDAAPDASTVAKAAKDSGIAIAALSGTYNMIHPDKAVRETGHRRLAVLASIAASLPTRLITLCTGTRDAEDQWRDHPDNHTNEAWRDLLASMETAIGIADKYDIDLGIEPELANVVNSAAKARQLIDELASPRLKIIFDAANLFVIESSSRQRDIISAAIDLLADRIAMAHAKDRNADGSFATAGKGVIDFEHYISHLKSAGFNGPLITHGLAADEAAGVATVLSRSCGRGKGPDERLRGGIGEGESP